MTLRRNPACPICGDYPTQTGLIDYDVFCGITSGPRSGGGAEGQDVPDVEPSGVAAQLASDEPPFLLDVREPWEWAVSNLADRGARLIPLKEIESRLVEIPEDRPVVVYCRTGQRSLDAALLMRDAGWPRVSNLRGGIVAWAREIEPGIPVV